MFFYPSKDRVEGVFVWTSPFLLIFIFRGALGTEWGIVGGDVVFSSASSSRNLFSSFSCAFSIFLLARASLDSMYRHCGLLDSSHPRFLLIICVSFVVPFLYYKIYRWNVTERFAPHIKRPYSAKVYRGVWNVVKTFQLRIKGGYWVKEAGEASWGWSPQATFSNLVKTTTFGYHHGGYTTHHHTHCPMTTCLICP